MIGFLFKYFVRKFTVSFIMLQDKYTKDTEWKHLIELTRDKIATSTTQQELQLLYTQIMKGRLNIII